MVVLAAKRAKQIKGGAPVLIKTDSENPLTVALEEIADGKIIPRVPDNDAIPKEKEVLEVAQLFAIPEETPAEGAEEGEIKAAETTAVEEEVKVVIEESAEAQAPAEEQPAAKPKKKRKTKAEAAETAATEEKGEPEVEAQAPEEEPDAKPKKKRKTKADKSEAEESEG